MRRGFDAGDVGGISDSGDILRLEYEVRAGGLVAFQDLVTSGGRSSGLGAGGVDGITGSGDI